MATVGYKGLRGGYKGMQGVTMGYRGLQRVTGGYKGLQGVSGGYKGLQVCDYRRRNEEWRPSIYSRLYNLIVKGDYMSKA